MRIRDWLTDLSLERLADVFERNDIDLDMLRELGDADLEKIGVDSLGARQKILKALRAGEPAAAVRGPEVPVGLPTAAAGAPSAGLQALMAGTIVGAAPDAAASPTPSLSRGMEAINADSTFIPTEQLPTNSSFAGLPSTGDRLGGRYKLMTFLGKGAMGAVYRAWDEKLRQELAVKVVLPEALANPAVREQFVREAQRALGLTHPNLLRVNTIEDSPCDFLVMEFIDGGNLTDRWATRRKKLDPEDVQQLLGQVLRGLAHLHGEGLVHRDVKPDNVLLTKDGKVKLADYGVSTSLREQRQNAQVAGTLRYMAPEQLRGDGELDGRVDLYAVGLMAHQLLLGRFPFDANDVEAIKAWHLAPERNLAALADLPWGHVFVRALAFDPAERWESAEGMAAALRGSPTPVAAVRPAVVRVGAGGDVATVAEALAAVADDGTIRVLAGEYECSVTLQSGVIIESDGTAKVTLYSTTGPVFRIEGGMPTVRGVELVQRRSPAPAPLTGDSDFPEKSAKSDEERVQEAAVLIVAGSPRFLHCRIRSVGETGVVVRGPTSSPEFHGCDVIECGDTGVVFQDQADGTFADGKVKACRRTGIEVEGARARIMNSTVSGCSLGIVAAGSVVMEGCEISRVSGHSALLVRGGPFRVKSTTIAYNEHHGVEVDALAHDVMFEDCTMEANGRANLYIYGGRTIQFSQCRFIRAQQDAGVIVASYQSGYGDPVFHSCDFSENRGPGLLVSAGGNPQVNASKFHRSRESHGIVVALGGRGTFLRCDSSDNAEAGIEVATDGGYAKERWSTAYVEGDRCVFSAEAGENDTNRNTVLRRINLTPWPEADDLSAAPEYAKSFADLLAAGNPTVYNCRFTGSKRGFGILVHEHGRGTFIGCESSGNKRGGIAIRDAARPTLIGCRVEGGCKHCGWDLASVDAVCPGCILDPR